MSVLLIATGGTIASTLGTDGRATATLTGTDLVTRLPIAALPDMLSVQDMAVAGSWNMGTGGALEIATEARKSLSADMDSVVVTHGTDVMEETAWVMELISRSPTSALVLTGSMRHADSDAYDGSQNLADAFTLAGDAGAKGRGSLVCLAGQIHHARWVVKTHASAVDALSSPNGRPIGQVVNGEVKWLSDSPPPPPPVPHTIGGPVPIILAHWDADPDVVDWHLDRGAVGIVIEATGAGNVNGAMVPGVLRAVRSGVPVVVATRCRGGEVEPTYGGLGGFAALAAEGVVGSAGLTAGKARVSLQLLLGASSPASLDEVANWFDALDSTNE